MECKKNTESINPKVSKTHNERIMFSSKCALCSSEKLRFIKEQDASRLFSESGIRTPLSKIPLLGDILKEYKSSSIVLLLSW